MFGGTSRQDGAEAAFSGMVNTATFDSL